MPGRLAPGLSGKSNFGHSHRRQYGRFTSGMQAEFLPASPDAGGVVAVVPILPVIPAD
jgi:hypothetical protein